ncbi:MAG: hypothetical protein V3V14_01675 [Saprospiraceae bacterium]
MYNLHQGIDNIENNVKLLIRKLNETIHNNELLLKENKKLTEALKQKELSAESVDYIDIEKKNYKESSKQKIKNDILSCIENIDNCLTLIK